MHAEEEERPLHGTISAEALAPVFRQKKRRRAPTFLQKKYLEGGREGGER